MEYFLAISAVAMAVRTVDVIWLAYTAISMPLLIQRLTLFTTKKSVKRTEAAAKLD